MEDILGLTILSFFIWICYLNWKKHSVMVDCLSYYSEPSVSQEYKNLSGPKIEKKLCENGSTSYLENPEIKKENSAFLYKKPTPSPDNELVLPDVLDINSEEKVVLTPLPFLDPFDDPEMEYDFLENESFCSDYPDPWGFPKVVHIHFIYIPVLHDMPLDILPELAVVTHIHTDKAQIREFLLRHRGVSKITEDPDIPCEYPSVTEPVVIEEKRKNKFRKAMTKWKKWIATHSRKTRTEKEVFEITKPVHESKRKNKFRKLRSKWEKWTAYFLAHFPSQDANDWEDHTVHVHNNLLDEFAEATRQKEELEQSEADDIKESVEHIHVLHVGQRTDEKLHYEYKQYPKVYHIHYVEISKEFYSDIAKNRRQPRHIYVSVFSSNGHGSNYNGSSEPSK
ncbi:Uncharacterized protein APZ42_026578 [Daphnia magna]|uniref:Uncharacterized protein n=1 Tax=Daphnia magna TaxID=35525 RepID=A0A164S4U3_9CRUS|nr:Uncharacterized protein APZ42_026578 [Daphnia magna]